MHGELGALETLSLGLVLPLQLAQAPSELFCQTLMPAKHAQSRGQPREKNEGHFGGATCDQPCATGNLLR